MAEHVHVLTLAEDRLVAVLTRRHREAVQRADAEFAQDMGVFCAQLKVPDGTRFSYEPAIASVIPARLIYDAADPAPAPPAPPTDLGDKESAPSPATS